MSNYKRSAKTTITKPAAAAKPAAQDTAGMKYPGIYCGICGKPSVEFDSHFNWYPCEEHKHLTPVEYSRMTR